MKTIQRNKIKFKVFTEEELKEKLGMGQEDIKVVLEYQDKFPELLQDKGEGFCINGRKLHEQLVEDVKINKDKTIYLICFSALRSYIAARILTQKGYHCFHLAGGYRLFKSLNF